jgi:hypothetical protein
VFLTILLSGTVSELRKESEMDIIALRELTCGLVEQAWSEVSSLVDTKTEQEERRSVASYYLFASREYTEGAWQMLSENRRLAALALSRWPLEAALNLLWVLADNKEVDKRVNDLRAKALWQEEALHRGIAEAWPNFATPHREIAEKVANAARGLGARSLDSLEKRMEELEGTDVATEKLGELGPMLYVYYRICSVAIHAHPRVWEDPDKRVAKPWVIYRIAASSPLYLVAAAHCLTVTGDIDKLYKWWAEAELLLDKE